MSDEDVTGALSQIFYVLIPGAVLLLGGLYIWHALRLEKMTFDLPTRIDSPLALVVLVLASFVLGLLVELFSSLLVRIIPFLNYKRRDPPNNHKANRWLFAHGAAALPQHFSVRNAFFRNLSFVFLVFCLIPVVSGFKFSGYPTRQGLVISALLFLLAVGSYRAAVYYHTKESGTLSDYWDDISHRRLS